MVITDNTHRAQQAYSLAEHLVGFDCVIGTGISVVEDIIKHSGKKIFIGDPQEYYEKFDIILVPSHEPHPNLPNIYETVGLLNHIQPIKEFKKNTLAVLIGGKHVGGNFTAHDAIDLFKYINTACFVTTSRRTEELAIKQVKQILKPKDIFYNFNKDGQVNNPYNNFLLWAEKIIVTADSARMMSEACSTGKPVFIFTPKQTHFSYLSLKNTLISNLYAQDIAEINNPKPQKTLQESKRIAEFIKQFFLTS